MFCNKLNITSNSKPKINYLLFLSNKLTKMKRDWRSIRFDFSTREGLRFFLGNISNYQYCKKDPEDDFHPDRGFFNQPVDYENIEICVLVGEQDLYYLTKLIPKVKKLVIDFCEPTLKRDISGLCPLLKSNGGFLEELCIISFSENDLIRIKNHHLLVGQIDVFTINGINAYNYQNKTVKDPRYSHINKIVSINDVLVYTFSIHRLNTKILYPLIKLSEDNNICNEIIVQLFPGNINTYLLFVSYIDYETQGHPVTSKLINLREEDFFSILYQNFNIDKSSITLPKSNQDLIIEDDDTVGELTIYQAFDTTDLSTNDNISKIIESDEDEDDEEDDEDEDSE